MVNPDPAMFPVFGFGKKVKEQKNYYNFISFFALVVQKMFVGLLFKKWHQLVDFSTKCYLFFTIS